MECLEEYEKFPMLKEKHVLNSSLLFKILTRGVNTSLNTKSRRSIGLE